MQSTPFFTCCTLLFWLCMPNFSAAQTPTNLQVVTKTIKRNYEPTSKITIKGEKANIDLQGWDQPRIEIEVRLIAKHANRSTAEKELKYMRFFGERKGSREVYLHNYFAVPKNLKAAESLFQTEYIVRVPTNIHVRIDNYVGNTKLSRITGSFHIDVKYGNLELAHLEGPSTVHLNLGDLLGTELKGNLFLVAHHASLNLNNLQGNLKVDGANSQLEVQPNNEDFALQVLGRNMDVSVLTAPTLNNYDYQLATTLGSIRFPEKSEMHNTQLGVSNQQPARLLDIQLTIGNIIIR